MLVLVQKVNEYEHYWTFLPTPVQTMDPYKHLYALKEIRIFTYKK